MASIPETNLGRLPDRADKALAFIDRGGKGLEIGPAHNPLAPKRDGFDVQIVDHLPTDELRAKYVPHGIDVNGIEEVDVVWHGEPLAELLETEHAYDWILASHVLEHVPDPVSFLLGCQRLLRPEGVLSLALPDKRYCFDHFRPLSTAGGLLDAFYERRVRPTPGNVVDHISSAVHRLGDIAWFPGDERPLAVVHSIDDIRNGWEEASGTDHYVDVHVWTFTPESFHLILTNLWTLGIITLGIRGEFEGETEFFVSLTPGHPMPDAHDRLAALAALQEVPDGVADGPVLKHPVAESEPASGVHEPVSEASGDPAATPMPATRTMPETTTMPATRTTPETTMAGTTTMPGSTTMQVSTRELALLTGKRQFMNAVRTLAGAVSTNRRFRP